MAKITQGQLIGTLSQLKEIKPRKDWAVLLKSQILAEPTYAKSFGVAKKVSIFDVISNFKTRNGYPQISNLFSRRMAYAFAVVMLLIVGIFGLSELTNMPAQSPAALTAQVPLKQSVANLNTKINDLAQVAKIGKQNSIPATIKNEIQTNAKTLAKNLNDNPADPQTIKEIAGGLKVLADVPGTDLIVNPDVRDLYQAVVQSQIADLYKMTLPADQKEILNEVQDLYLHGKYADALEKILLINK